MHDATTDLLVVRGADVHAPAPLGCMDLVLGGGRVLAMGRDLAVGTLPCVELDARGLIAAPGLVDSLVHLSGGGGEGGFATRTAPLRGEDALAAGVTTLVGALGTDDVTRSLADLLACARALAVHGLSAYALTGSYHVPVRTLTASVRDDLVLVPDFIGVGEVAIADHRGAQPTVDELARIASEARVGGMLAGKQGTVLVHVGDHDDGLALLAEVCRRHPVPTTQWLPTHVNRHATLLAQGERWMHAGGYVDLTTSTTPELVTAGDIPADAALARLLADGADPARITLSSDGQASLPDFAPDGTLRALGVAPIGSLLRAVRDAVRSHRLPLESALAAATANPARVWGLRRKGTLRVGADADLLLLEPGTLALRATVASGRVTRFSA
jgi:beta-aspartyl-dipeptidase (metallo-type)